MHGDINAKFIDMKKLQSDKNLTKQIRIDSGYHSLLKIKAAKSGMSIKTLLEGFIIEGLEDETAGKEISS